MLFMNNSLIPILSSKEYTTVSRNLDCPIHRHVNCEFLFIVQGKIINTVNGISVTAQPGSVFFVNNLVTHSLKQTENAYEHRDVYISNNHVKAICNQYFDAYFYDYLMSIDNVIQINLPIEIFSSFLNRLERNQMLFALHKDKREIIKRSNLNIMISLFGILYEQTDNYPSIEKGWLTEFLIKIQTPKVFVYPIKKIIALSGYSASYFSHMFSKTFNMSFKSYITKLRINYAKLLLNSSDLPIIDIAIDCGFSSQSHFTQIFKEVTGITPYQYRHSQTNSNQNLPQLDNS